MPSDDWFERLMGFAERRYEDTQRQLSVEGDELVSAVNHKRYGIGTLTMPTLEELRRRVTVGDGRRSTVRTMVGDVRALHSDAEFDGALFQVASQFNLLEMVSERVTPEQGVARYANDLTQGPACAMAAGAATIYRNYCVPVGGQTGQTADCQLDGLAELGTELSARLDLPVSALWEMRNGYALCTETGLRAIEKLLTTCDDDSRDVLRGKLAIGVHRDVQVTDVLAGPRRHVSQAFCSALPVAYTVIDGARWASFARLVLEAAYEATLLAAVEQANGGGSPTVLLTRLGGGAFGNAAEWIDDAIVRALAVVEHAGLDIRLVDHHRNPSSTQIARRWGQESAAIRKILGDNVIGDTSGPARRPSWPHDRLVHAWWVEKDRLLAGEYPFSRTPEEARQKVRVLVDAGVTSFVDLTDPHDVPAMLPYTDVLRQQADDAGRPLPRYRRFPIPDTKTIAQKGYDEILAYIQSEMDAGNLVYVHCWGGKGRTSTVIGCRLIDGGLDFDGAMAQLRRLRAGTKKAGHPVPDTQAQADVLRDRVGRRDRRATT